MFMVKSNFYDSLFFRISTGLAHAFICYQTFRTTYAISSIFSRNKPLLTLFTWAIKVYSFIWFAFRAGVSFTIWKRALITCLTLTSGINNILCRWTVFTSPSIRTKSKSHWFKVIIKAASAKRSLLGRGFLLFCCCVVASHFLKILSKIKSKLV